MCYQTYLLYPQFHPRVRPLHREGRRPQSARPFLRHPHHRGWGHDQKGLPGQAPRFRPAGQGQLSQARPRQDGLRPDVEQVTRGQRQGHGQKAED